MTNFQRLSSVRTRFLLWLQNVSECSEEAGVDGSLIHRESMLIRDEFFCGRKFHAENYTGVWFIEEDVLKIHRTDGSLELVLRGSEIDVSQADAIAVESRHAETAAIPTLSERQTPAEGISDPAPANASGKLESEPRILKLTSLDDDMIDSSEQSSGQTIDEMPSANEHQTDEIKCEDQEIRKAA